MTCCRNCGGDFSHAESPYCPSCGLHLQDLICRGCGDSYRMMYSERTEYPCPSCGRDNLKRDFLILDTPTFFEETEYVTPYPPTGYPFDETTSPYIVKMLSSTNAPFERKMPFTKRENRVDLAQYLLDKMGKNYRIDAVSLVCDTSELPLNSAIRLTIRDQRSCKVIKQSVTPERKKREKCLFLFEAEPRFYSGDLTFTLEVEKEGKACAMNVPVARAYSSSWIQWKDSSGCLFTPALTIYGDYYITDTGEAGRISTTFPYDRVDMTDYPDGSFEYPVEDQTVLLELVPDYGRVPVPVVVSGGSDRQINLNGLLPSGYQTFLTGISFVCDTLQIPEDVVMRLHAERTYFPDLDVSIIPPRDKNAVCRFSFEPQRMYDNRFDVHLAYEWAGNVAIEPIRLLPSLCNTTLARWRSREGWHYSPAMTLHGYMLNPETGERFTPLADYPLFEPEYPTTNYPTTDYPTTDYPTTDYPTTEYPTTDYQQDSAFRREPLFMEERGLASCDTEANSLRNIPMNVSMQEWGATTDYPTTAYPSGADDNLIGNFNGLEQPVTEVTCYNTGDPDHGILDFNFDFGPVSTQPSRPSGSLSFTSPTLDGKFSSPSGLQYKQPTQRHIGGFNSPTGLLKDANQVCVMTEAGYPRFTDFTNDPAGERTDRSQMIPEFLRKVTVDSEDGSGLPMGEECFEETLEDGTVLRYSMETGTVVAVRQGDSSWLTAEDLKNNLRIIYEKEGGGYSENSEVEMKDDIRKVSQDTSGSIRQIWSSRDGLADVVTLSDTSYRISWYKPEQVTGFSESKGLFGVESGAVPLKSWTMEATPIAFYQDEKGKMYEQDTGRPLTKEDLAYLRSLRITEQRGSLRFVREWDQLNPTTMIYTRGDGADKEAFVTVRQATDPVTPEELAQGNSTLDASFLKVGNVYTHELEMSTEVQGLPVGYRTRYRRYPFGDVCLLEEKGGVAGAKETVSYQYELNSTSRNYGCCIRETYSNGKTIEYEYDRMKRLISRKEPWGNGDSQVTRYTYCNARDNDLRIASETKSLFRSDEEERIMSRTLYSYGETPALKWMKISKMRRGGPVIPANLVEGGYGDALPEVTLTEWYGKDAAQNGAASSLAAGRLKRIVGPDGVELQYTYEAGTEPGITCVGTMTQMVNGAVVPGLSTRKASYYDAWGKVVREREYVHTGAGFTRTDEKNYTYDASRRVSRTDYSNGRHTESCWICVGPLEETDEHGRKTRYEYNSAKRLKREIQESLSYVASQGEPSTITPVPEKVTEYGYDGAGRQIRQTVIQGQKRVQTLTELDALGRSVRVTEADGTVKLYSYSSDGLETTVTNPTGAVYSWRDNPDGSQASETGTGLQPRYYHQYVTDFGVRSDVRVDSVYGELAETKETDGMGRVLMEGVARGQGMTETRIWYSEKGRPFVKRGEGLPSVWMEYDALGNLTYESVDLRVGGSEQSVYTRVSYIYGVLPVSLPSLPSWMNTPLVWKKTIRSDSHWSGSPVTATTWELVSRTLSEADRAVVTRDKKGRETMTWQCTVDGKSYEYTLASESKMPDRTVSVNGKTLLVEKHGQGTLTYDYTFVSGGERCVMKDARGNTLTRETDLMNRSVSETDAQGNTVTRKYDTVTGLLKKMTSPLGGTTEYEYDGRGNLVAQFGTAVQPMCFEYDPAGRLSSLTTFRVPGEVLTASPRGRTDGDVTRWTYDPASSVVLSKTMPDGREYRWRYDHRGQVTSMVLPGGRVREFRYGELGGLLKAIHFDDETPPVKVMYNGDGGISGIEDASGLHSFEYDEWKDIKRETISGPRSFLMEYDWGTGGRIDGYGLKIGTATVQQTAYGYGTGRKLNSITLDGDWTYRYTWNEETGLPEKITWPDGVSREMTYENQRNLVKKLTYGKVEGTPILSLEKTFDPLARLTAELHSPAGEGLRRCTYNDRGEVISDARDGGNAWTYSYDNIGNRKTWAGNGEEEKSYLTNPLNQYTAITEGYGSTQEVFAPCYDETGSQILVRTETGDWQVAWNSENRPVCFTRGNERVECVYDYMGRRVRKTLYRDDVPISRRIFIYNGYKLIAELNDLEESDEKSLARTWLWDPTGVFDNSPLEMRVWNESGEEGYPEVEGTELLVFSPQGRVGTQYPAVRLETGRENRLNLAPLVPTGCRLHLQGLRLTVDTLTFKDGISLKATVSDGQVTAVSRLTVGRQEEYPCLFLFEETAFSSVGLLTVKLEMERDGLVQKGDIYLLPAVRRSGMAVWKTVTPQSMDDRFTPGMSLYGTVVKEETGELVSHPSELTDPEGPFFEPTDRDIILRDRGVGMRIDRSSVWHIPLKTIVPPGKKIIMESVELAIGRSPEGKYLEEKEIFFAVNGSWGLKGQSFGNTYRLDLSGMPEEARSWEEYREPDFLALEFYGNYPVYCDDRGPLLHVTGRLEETQIATTGYPTTDYPSESIPDSSSSSSDSPSESGTDYFVPLSSEEVKIHSPQPVPRSAHAGLIESAASVGAEKRYYYLNDGNRNIIALRTPEDGVCATYTYGTYGQCLKVSGACAEHNPFRYSSEYYDRELGMVYYNYRHYNPLDGRWLSRDPKEEAGGVNLYGFCSNNPVSRRDHLGLSELPGASGTGLSTHWGNIVREKGSWAIVCYKYYKGGIELGSNAELDIWEPLAKANKLNYEEREKWVMGYKPLPESGDIFFVPNTFVIYTTKSEPVDKFPGHPIRSAKDWKLPVIKERFTRSGVNIVEELEKEDHGLFKNLWQTNGIFGFGFVGHGAGYVKKILGFWPIKEEWYGVCTTTDGMNFVRPDEVNPPYKLAFIAAFSCGAEEAGWGNKGGKYPLSLFGQYIGYSGRFTMSDDDSHFIDDLVKDWYEINKTRLQYPAYPRYY